MGFPRHYYNDNDPKSVIWIKELIRSGLIPDGEVDGRSIIDVKPEDLKGFVQCHFFAGISGWPLALKMAGVPEDKRVWSGSAPCQPFSTAGKQLGTVDSRHLWPAFFRLVEACRPPLVMGEQVASAKGRVWMSNVRLDLESAGYAVAAADLCASAIGAPHIRQRLYWVASLEDRNGKQGVPGAAERRVEAADAAGEAGPGVHPQSEGVEDGGGRPHPGDPGGQEQVAVLGGVADPGGDQRGQGRDAGADGGGAAEPAGLRAAGRLVDAGCDEPGEGPGDDGEVPGFPEEECEPELRPSLFGGAVESCGVGDAEGDEQQRHPLPEWDGERLPAGGPGGPGLVGVVDASGERLVEHGERDRQPEFAGLGAPCGADASGPGEDGFWDRFELIPCLDNRVRRVEPGSFPLVARVPAGVVRGGDQGEPDVQATGEARVMRLRGYGNAICAPLAAEFIRAAMDCLPGLGLLDGGALWPSATSPPGAPVRPSPLPES